MKKPKSRKLLALIGMTFIMGSPTAQAFDINLDAQTRVTQTEYIQNDILDILAEQQEFSKTEAFEKLTLKCKKRLDDVQLVFENRMVLWPDKTEIEHIVDNAYFSIESGPFVLYFGKQRIKWGTGFFWNPVDVLQTPKDIFDLTESLEGITALRAEYSNPWVTPSVIVALAPNDYGQETSSSYKFGLQLYKLIGTMDLFLNSVYWHNNMQSLGSALSWDVDWFIINAEAAALKYMNDQLSLNQTLKEQASPIHYNYLLGLSRKMGETFFITAEYYHHGGGLDNTDFDIYIDELRQDPAWLQYMGSAMKKDYTALNLSYTWDNTWEINMVAMIGLNDGTAYLYPKLSYVENPNYTIALGYFKNYATAINHEGYYATPIQYAIELRAIGYF